MDSTVVQNVATGRLTPNGKFVATASFPDGGSSSSDALVSTQSNIRRTTKLRKFASSFTNGGDEFGKRLPAIECASPVNVKGCDAAA
jgi:hypothetical protein